MLGARAMVTEVLRERLAEDDVVALLHEEADGEGVLIGIARRKALSCVYVCVCVLAAFHQLRISFQCISRAASWSLLCAPQDDEMRHAISLPKHM